MSSLLTHFSSIACLAFLQCPSCRVSCPSRRNLRKDDAFNAVITAIYPDLSKAESAQEAHIQEVIKSYNVRKFGEIASKGARQQRDQAKRSTKRPASPPPSFGGHAAFAAPVAKRPRNPNKPEPISIMLQQHPTLRDADAKLRDQYKLPNKFVRTSRYITVLLLKKWLQLKLCKPKSAAVGEAAKSEATESKEPEAAAADAAKMEDSAQPDAAAAASSSAAAAAAASSSVVPAASSSLASGLPAPVVTLNVVTPPVRFVLYVRAFDLQLLDATPLEQNAAAGGPPGQEIYVPLASDLTLDYIEEYMWNSEAKTANANAAQINAGLAVAAMTDGDPTPLLQKAFAQSFVQCASHRKSKTACPQDCKDRMAAWHEFLTREHEKFNKYKEAQKAPPAPTLAADGSVSASAPAAAGGVGVPPLVSLPYKKRRLVIYFSVVGADGQLLTEVPAMAPEVVAKYVITPDEEEGGATQQPYAAAQQHTPMQMDEQPASATV